MTSINILAIVQRVVFSKLTLNIIKLQQLQNDYPLVPDKIEIHRKILSEYQLKIADLYNIPIGNVKKLPNAFGKEKYVIHYENLKFYLRLGLKLKKIHRILEFNQSQWLKQYVDFNKQKIRSMKKMELKITFVQKLSTN